MLKIHLLVIDPQKDFVAKSGSLSVPGADADMDRLALMVRRLGDKLDDIHVTLDSHRKVDISHPMWWRDTSGKAPPPFTVISAADLESGRWSTKQPSAHAKTLRYLKSLASTGRYPHVVWPEHCLIGDEGSQVWPILADAMHEWERDVYGMVDFVTKGSNPWTEHFSGVKAEVPEADDPSTQVNTKLIETLEKADVVLLAGEARSHCLANTVRDIRDNFSDPKLVEKLVLLTDATSDVPTFEKYGTDFVAELMKNGMKLSTTKDFLA